jgi:predicted GIY-YIG superfamily endonuclease
VTAKYIPGYVKNGLTIVERVEHDGRKYFRVKCDKCASDSEMYGDGTFLQATNSFSRGNVPCGCSANYEMSKEQYETLLRRKYVGLDHEFVGIFAEWNRSLTKAEMFCKIHNKTWESTYVSKLLGKECGCPYCKAENSRVRATKESEELIRKFFNTGVYHPDTKFLRGTRTHSWYYLCPVCKNDEFASAGLCDGIFQSTTAKLGQGLLACRCSHIYKWPIALREYQVVTALLGSKYTFKGWAEGYVGSKSKVSIQCLEHGTFDIGLQSFLNGSRCASCVQGGYKRLSDVGYVYALKIEGFADSFVGFGVTNNFDRRLKQHTAQLGKHGYHVDMSYVLKTTGAIAFDLEKEIKSNFPLKRVGVKGFVSEAMPSSQYLKLIDFIKESGYIYEGTISSAQHSSIVTGSNGPV